MSTSSGKRKLAAFAIAVVSLLLVTGYLTADQWASSLGQLLPPILGGAP